MTTCSRVLAVLALVLSARVPLAAGLTDVEVTLRVVDTQTGALKTHVNARGIAFQPSQDTSAFATCP